MFLIKKYFFTISALILCILPQFVSAHIKWFVDSEDVIKTSHNTIPFYNATSYEVFIWAVLIFVAVLMFSMLDSRITQSPKKLIAFGEKHKKGIFYSVQFLLGSFLLSISFLWNIVLIPEFHVVDTVGMIAKWIQVAIGCMFICNVFPRVAAFFLAVMTLGLGYVFGYEALAENALLLSLCVFFFIVHAPKNSWWNRFEMYAVEIVRIGTGISLIVLAFTEKLMYPELSIAFLDVHHWNFMQPLFPWFTNSLFVLSTGFAEIAFGIIFILGYLTRVNTVIISSFFLASVITMFVQFGAWEVEDLVVYAAAVLFIFYGHGKTKFFHHVWLKSWLRKVIV